MEETLWQERDKTYNIYNIYAEKVVLLDVNDRKYVVKGLGQSNIWYGNEEEDRKVETIIENYEKGKINKVTEIEKYTEELEGKEKEVSNCDIELSHVTFAYNQENVIKDISCKIPQGSVTALVGPSGSGKSIW